jgi:hypothetical protein
MKVSEIAIVTITLVRTREEESSLLHSLEKLAGTNVPLVIADGGSAKRFVKELLNFTDLVVTPEKKGLVQQVKAGLAGALTQFADKRAILYTEPDKYPFFEGRLFEFITTVPLRRKLGVIAAGRDAKSFRTFPIGQQQTEAFMNEAFSWIVGEKGDYCYGPLIFSRPAAEIALDSPNDLGWGWRFWTMQRAHATGLQVRTVPMNLSCPKEQRAEDSFEHRAYRLKQLTQNIHAITSVVSKKPAHL